MELAKLVVVFDARAKPGCQEPDVRMHVKADCAMERLGVMIALFRHPLRCGPNL